MKLPHLNLLFENHYRELKVRAARQLKRWAGRLPLEENELVHLLFERMSGKELGEVDDEQGFLNLAERQMKWLLTDRYRQSQSLKKGGGEQHFSIDDHFSS